MLFEDGGSAGRNTRISRPGPARRSVPVGDGVALGYFQAGTGPDVVLIHGALVTADDMRLGPFDALARHARVTAVDRPGHGESGRRRGRDALPAHQAAMIREGLRAIGVRRPVLVGHSFGGAVAIAYALDFPDEVAGVVALAPICFPELRLEQILFGPRSAPGFGDALAATAGIGSDALVLPALWRAMFLPQAMPHRFAEEFSFALASRSSQMIATGEDAAALWPGLAGAALRYGGCRPPVDILGGDSDMVVNNLLHGAVAARMMPQGSFRLLPGQGHMLHHACPEEVVAAVGRRLEGGRPEARP